MLNYSILRLNLNMIMINKIENTSLKLKEEFDFLNFSITKFNSFCFCNSKLFSSKSSLYNQSSFLSYVFLYTIKSIVDVFHCIYLYNLSLLLSIIIIIASVVKMQYPTSKKILVSAIMVMSSPILIVINSFSFVYMLKSKYITANYSFLALKLQIKENKLNLIHTA